MDRRVRARTALIIISVLSLAICNSWGQLTIPGLTVTKKQADSTIILPTSVRTDSLFGDLRGTFYGNPWTSYLRSDVADTAIDMSATVLRAGALAGIYLTTIPAYWYDWGDKSITAFGVDAGWDSLGGTYTTGTPNTFYGHKAGTKNTTGSRNVFLGHNSGRSNVTGGANTYVGEDCFAISDGSYNAGLGLDAGFNLTGDENTIVGTTAYMSVYSNAVANKNCVFGSAGGSNSLISGSKNALFGYGVGKNDSITSKNCLFGYRATTNIPVCSTAVGMGDSVVVGSGCVAIGSKAQATLQNSGALGANTVARIAGYFTIPNIDSDSLRLRPTAGSLISDSVLYIDNGLVKKGTVAGGATPYDSASVAANSWALGGNPWTSYLRSDVLDTFKFLRGDSVSVPKYNLGDSAFAYLTAGNRRAAKIDSLGINGPIGGGTSTLTRFQATDNTTDNIAIGIFQHGNNLNTTTYRDGILIGQGGNTGDLDLALYTTVSYNTSHIQSVKLQQSYQNLVLNPQGGNVGIGLPTTAPTQKLDVRGSIITSNVAANAKVTLDTMGRVTADTVTANKAIKLRATTFDSAFVVSDSLIWFVGGVGYGAKRR